MQKEIDFLGNAVENPERPFVAILGGAKVSEQDLPLSSDLLDKVRYPDHRRRYVLYLLRKLWEATSVLPSARMITWSML